MKRSTVLHILDSEAGGGGTDTLDAASFQRKVLAGVEALNTKIAEFETGRKATQADIDALKKQANEVGQQLLELQRKQAAARVITPRRPGEVSIECARHLGALVIAAASRQGKLSALEPSQRETLLGIAKDVLGVEVKTALSSSDIPLPTEYSGDVTELVSMYGAARRYGTVFPLGAGTVNLPRLKTDTTFTLLAQATAITEKSPQTEWVTFTPEKFGGMVRIPSELDADSIVPIGQFIARYAARNIARSEDHNFFVGTGAASGVNGTAKGLTALASDNSKVATMGTGLASPSEISLAKLREARTKVDAAALATAAYYMHPTMEALLASLNAAGDRPYNPQAQIMGTGANPILTGPTLDGFPIRWVDVMQPYVTTDVASTVCVLFGDLSYGYLGVRGGIRFDTSSEAGFTTDEILVRALERFTVQLMATGAVGGVKTAA
jgi:HK97 family phage major capsid protein